MVKHSAEYVPLKSLSPDFVILKQAGSSLAPLFAVNKLLTTLQVVFHEL